MAARNDFGTLAENWQNFANFETTSKTAPLYFPLFTRFLGPHFCPKCNQLKDDLEKTRFLKCLFRCLKVDCQNLKILTLIIGQQKNHFLQHYLTAKNTPPRLAQKQDPPHVSVPSAPHHLEDHPAGSDSPRPGKMSNPRRVHLTRYRSRSHCCSRSRRHT